MHKFAEKAAAKRLAKEEAQEASKGEEGAQEFKQQIRPVNDSDPLFKFKIPFNPEQLMNLDFGHLRDVVEEIIKSLSRHQLQLTTLQTSVFKAHEGLSK